MIAVEQLFWSALRVLRRPGAVSWRSVVTLQPSVRLPRRAACSSQLLELFILGLSGRAVRSHLASQLLGRRAVPSLGTSAEAFESGLLGSFAASCRPEREPVS